MGDGHGRRRKIGFYESPDLKKLDIHGRFYHQQIGLVECPDLYMMRADDGTAKWVLGVSANGKPAGKPNTYAYWTGNFDGRNLPPIKKNRNGSITALTGTAASHLRTVKAKIR